MFGRGGRQNGGMARRSATPPPPADFEENIVDIDVAEAMRGSYLEYAYSVISRRARRDAGDGLKPVQRRILYQMNQMGLRPDRGHVKCARVVGEVMGRLHPHGDSAIYDALVRLAQPFAMRLPMVDGHGNFGSQGGDDPPAAMRYTEARLTAAAMEMVNSIDEDTVDFQPNYDGQETEPSVLPAALPNLLVNGASGIAVGMATNMAPHNLGEVIAAVRYLIKHPDAGLDALMRYVPGPDLPTHRAQRSAGWRASGTRTRPAGASSAPGRPAGSSRSRPGGAGSWSPSCRTASGRKRSSPGSRTWSSPRS